MRRVFLFALLFSAGLANGGIQYPAAESNVKYSSVTALSTGKPNHIIRYGTSDLQFGELWLPQKPKHKISPLIVLIHGGCWLNAFDISHTHALSTALMQAGFAVWSLEYRRTGDEGGGWPGSYDDVINGIRFVKTLKEYAIDKKNIVIMGHSAGGHLALLAGGNLKNTSGFALRGVVGLAPIVDLETYSKGDNSCQTATPKFMGGSFDEKPEEYRKADPSKHAFARNTALIHGDKDTIVPVSQSQQKGVELEIVAGAGHFDMIHPGTAAWQKILQTLSRLTTN